MTFTLILVTFLTGVGGIALGAAAGTLLGGISKKANAILMSFSAGTMIALICFELLPEAAESGISTVLLAMMVLASAALVAYIDYTVDRKSGHSHDFITCEDCDHEFEHDEHHEHCTHDEEDEGHGGHGVHPQERNGHDDHPQERNGHEVHLQERAGHDDHPQEGHGHDAHHHKKSSGIQLMLAGLTVAVGVAVHNLPEGMSIGAIFAGSGLSPAFTVLVASIVLHNIPEGIAIAIPLMNSKVGRGKAILLAALSGLPTVIGAVIGCSVGEMGEAGMAAALCFAAGTLGYVVFGEVLPQSINLYCSRKTAFAAIFGLAVGMVIIL